MKSNAECTKVSADTLEHVCSTVVKPANADELSKVVSAVMAAGGSISPLSRKGSHTEGDVLVDMSEMNALIDVDTDAQVVRAQAGCKFSAIIKAVEAEGYTIGVRPAGADPTVEDWIYTESEGIGSYKYGTVKDSVINIRAVDAAGKLLETGYDEIGYYMSGYNMIQTLAASSGRLAIVTEATFKIHPMGVTKAVGYEFPSAEKMQEVFQAIGQSPSLKPLQISFNGMLSIIAFQGAEEFVDADLEALDAIMAEAGAVKAEQSVADDKFGNIGVGACVNPEAATMYVPLRNMAAAIDAFKGVAGFDIAGNVPDKSTVAIKLTGEVSDADYDAAAGRSSTRCPSKYRDEATNRFIRRIEDAYMGRPVEDVKLSRQVTPAIIERLKAIVGAVNVSVSGMDKVLYSHDMAPLPKEAGLAFKNIPDVIVRPETVEQISQVMALAYEHGIAVTPRGNASWGLGGCMPTNAGILLDMSSKMKHVVEIDKENLTVKVQGGCTWKNLLEACMKEGYIIGSYPSSFPSGTIGAWYSTNGMGIGSYKYGSARENVVNAEIIVDDGSVVNTGFPDTGSYRASFNLNQFFSGAEGTLGVIGTMTFRLHPMGQIRCLAYEFDNLKDMDGPMQELVHHPSVRPLHVAWSDYKHFENQKRAGCHAPDVKNLWLVTLQGDEKHNDLEEAAVDAMAEKAGGRKIAGEIAEHEWEERCYEFRARRVGVGEIPAEVIVPTVHWGGIRQHEDGGRRSHRSPRRQEHHPVHALLLQGRRDAHRNAVLRIQLLPRRRRHEVRRKDHRIRSLLRLEHRRHPQRRHRFHGEGDQDRPGPPRRRQPRTRGLRNDQVRSRHEQGPDVHGKHPHPGRQEDHARRQDLRLQPREVQVRRPRAHEDPGPRPQARRRNRVNNSRPGGIGRRANPFTHDFSVGFSPTVVQADRRLPIRGSSCHFEPSVSSASGSAVTERKRDGQMCTHRRRTTSPARSITGMDGSTEAHRSSDPEPVLTPTNLAPAP